MGKKFQFTTLDRVISKVYRDLGIEEVSEVDLIEWAGEALEGIRAVDINEQAVAFIEVKNYQADIPNGLTSIIQIAKDNHYEKKNKLCPADIILDTNAEEAVKDNCASCKTTELSGGSIVTLDCNGNLIGDYEVAYYRPYFDLQYEYVDWKSSNQFQRFTPIRLSNHSFFGSLVCPEDKEIYTPNCCEDEYTVSNDKILLSFEEGQIAVAYNRVMIDTETGYPMIPDDYSVISAVTWYITWKYMARMWFMGKEGYERKMHHAEQQWQWYCKQAGNIAFGPHGIDEFQNLMEQSYRMIPDRTSYYKFFGKLGKPDTVTKWKEASNNVNKFRGI